MTLRVEGLSCARGGVTVLADVTFRVDPGRALVLRGPNGVGKTTLLRTIAGLQPPVAGQVSAAHESIAYAAHADGLKGVLTLRENLSFWAAIHGTATVDAAMAAMGLAALADRPAQDLSAGQKRRAGLARLLVTGRPVWLLDEPTVSLDTGAVATFAGVIAAHLAGGGMVVMASHLDAGIPAAAVLDLAAFRPVLSPGDAFDEAFG